MYDIFVKTRDNSSQPIFCICNKKNCLNVAHLVALSTQKGKLLQSLGFEYIEKPVEELLKMKRLQSLLKSGKQCNEIHENNTICDCLLWTGYSNPQGYGATVGGSIHKLRWELENGKITNMLQIRHKCKHHNNCFNIDHLEPGTSFQNAMDKKRDGTDPAGERNPSAKITNEIAQKIRNSKNEKDLSVKDRANMFGVSTQIVHQIDRNDTWAPGDENLKKRRRESREKRKEKIPMMDDYNKAWNRILSKCVETSTFEGTNCLEYQNSNGKYGSIYLMGRGKYPHQIAWIKFQNASPENSHARSCEAVVPETLVENDLTSLYQFVYRKCGNHSCVTPEHLVKGDMSTISGNKRKRGIVLGKISVIEAREIYELKDKMSKVDIAKNYGISAKHVSSIHQKKSHKYLHE